MLRKNLSEMVILFGIVPTGPILIKSGVEGGADPTIPDMNFVRTVHPDTGEKKPCWVKRGADHYYHATGYFLLATKRGRVRRRHDKGQPVYTHCKSSWR